MKCIYLLFVVSAVVVYFDSAYCYVSISNRDEIYEFIPEPPCAVQGGTCLRESECPAGLLTSTKGLCPAQKAQGAECCYGISTKETRCRARGGECVETAICGNAPLDELATDCASGEVCCIWLV